MSMCITVDRVDQKPKLSVVRTTNGRQLKCWTDKLGRFGLEAGGTYNIETEERPFGDNEVTMITGAKRVASAPTGSPSAAETYRQNGATSAPAPQPFRSPEQMFVSEVLVAYISSGRCEPAKLPETIAYIRRAWNISFGGFDAHMEAAAE